MRRNEARPGLGGDGRAANGAVVSGHGHSTPFQPVALAVQKRGRPCTIAKLVVAQPLAEVVLGMPYRHRQTVNHVSLPPIVLRYAREHGARLWVVRLDSEGVCYSLPLAEVERAGWLRASDGQPEWFVPLSRFRPIAWQDWDYVVDVVRLREPEPAASSQLALW
ncbi:MAG: hypothetical protein M1358_21320 [Chloroflexi bacterium]|nr:hypothetical protein [Chloroflexota bacterium]